MSNRAVQAAPAVDHRRGPALAASRRRPARTPSVSHELTHVVSNYTREPQRLIEPLRRSDPRRSAVLGGVILVVLGAYLIAVNPQPLRRAVMRPISLPRTRRQTMFGTGFAQPSWDGWRQSGSTCSCSEDLVAIGMTIIAIIGFLFARRSPTPLALTSGGPGSAADATRDERRAGERSATDPPPVSGRDLRSQAVTQVSGSDPGPRRRPASP